MNNNIFGIAGIFERVFKCNKNGFGFHIQRKVPTDRLARGEVNKGSEITKAAPLDMNVSNIGHPNGIELSNLKVAFDEIDAGVVGFGLRMRSKTLNGLTSNVVSAHDSSDTVLTNGEAGIDIFNSMSQPNDSVGMPGTLGSVRDKWDKDALLALADGQMIRDALIVVSAFC